MILVLIILVVLLAGLLYAGYYIFTTVFDNQFKAKENNDPDFLDSDSDLMRPTARRLYAYRETCSETFRSQNFKELEEYNNT